MQTGDSRGAETMSRRLPVGHLIRPSGTDTLQLEPATSSARPNSADRRLISASVEPVDLGAASWPGYGPPPVVELAKEATKEATRSSSRLASSSPGGHARVSGTQASTIDLGGATYFRPTAARGHGRPVAFGFGLHTHH